MNVKAVIFDMDGVIFDTESLVLKSWEYLAEIYHLGDIREMFLKCTGTNTETTMKIVKEHLGSGIDCVSLAAQASAWFHGYTDRNGVPMKKGVKELLSDIRGKGIPIALASSTKADSVTAMLKGAGIYEYFDSVIGGDMLEKSKPEPDIYLMAADRLGISPSGCAAVEDSFNGVRSAYSAGMKAIMVPDLLPPDEEMREKASIIADDLTQLIGMFEKE
ncbi:MAG: HAD family phosphatase [Oscillospiraceae bacterium]|nr:HAD family phosphatase [Oscillospiraceae bacterium]